MAVKENKLMQKRLLSSYLSSVLSISLVLLLVGVASLLLVNAHNVSDYFKEHMQMSVVFHPQVSEDAALRFQKELDAEEWVRSTEFVSREQGIREMEQLLGSDFLNVFETSPIPVSVNLQVRADYVTPTQLDSVLNVVAASDMVDEVVWQRSLLEALNSNLSRIGLVLGIFMAFLMFISVVLINNTLRLNLFDKRFSIHTMRLVGATKAFIRRPFLWRTALQGLLASLLAIILLLAALIVLKSSFAELFEVFRFPQMLTVMGIVVAAGLGICVCTGYVVVNHLVTLKKDELYF